MCVFCLVVGAGGGPLDRDPFPWEVPGEEMDDITEFRGQPLHHPPL